MYKNELRLEDQVWVMEVLVMESRLYMKFFNFETCFHFEVEIYSEDN